MSRDISFRLFEFNSSEFENYLQEEVLKDYNGNKSPLREIFSRLQRSYDPPCKSVIVEEPYFDKDYLDEFSSFYATSFKDYPAYTKRLHFFSRILCHKDIEKLEENNFYTGVEENTRDYIGFTIIRPIDLQKVGRTMLRSPEKNFNEFHLTESVNKSTILTTECKIKGMPYMQQDTQVGACAQATIWMAGRYITNRFHLREFYPSEITKFAKESISRGRKYPASRKGLIVDQMLEAFREMDLSADSLGKNSISIDDIPDTFYSKARDFNLKNELKQKIKQAQRGNDKDQEALKNEIKKHKRLYLADAIYKHVESEMPAVLYTRDHAILAIGHSYDFDNLSSLNILNLPSFLVHNDAVGPYLHLDFNATGKCHMDFSEIEGALFLLPKECSMSADDAEYAGLYFFKNYLNNILLPENAYKTAIEEPMNFSFKTAEDLMEKLIFRTYLRRGISLKQDIVSQRNIENSRLKTKISRLNLPKYVWVIEFTLPDYLDNNVRGNKRIGELVIDSTAPADSNCVHYLRIGNMNVLLDRNTNEDEFIYDSGDPLYTQYLR